MNGHVGFSLVATRRIAQAMIGILLAGTLCAAPEVYVASTGDQSTGADWAGAYTNIQTAIDAVDDGGTIFLKGETFTVTNQLEMIGGSDVTIRGGYEGVGSPGARDTDTWPTALRLAKGCEGRVFYVGSGTNVLLEGFSVSGGNVKGITSGGAGGGLCLSNVLSLTIRSCCISNNLAERYGGGIAVISAPTGGTVTMEQCTIATNRVKYSGTNTEGGGISVYWGGLVTLVDCCVRANNVSGNDPYGSGLAIFRSVVDATRTVFEDNWISARYPRGGGIRVGTGAALRLTGCIVRRNRCKGYGAAGAGILNDNGGRDTIRNTLFQDNIAEADNGSGGAFWNSAGAGATVDNCTFVGNQPGALQQAYTSTINLNNCIFWDNNGKDIGLKNVIVATYCDIQDGFNNGTNGCISVDPLFMRPSAGDYSLRTLSPCREQGTPLNWHVADTVDLAGNPRIMPKNGKVDMGAFEGLPTRGTLFLMR